MNKVTFFRRGLQTLFLRLAIAGLVLLGTTFVVVSRDEKLAGAWCTGLVGGGRTLGWDLPQITRCGLITHQSVALTG